MIIFFSKIDTEEKAYLLGWIASDGNIGKRGFSINIHQKDIKTIKILKNIICKEIPITYSSHTNDSGIITDMCKFSVNSQQISIDLCNYLEINPGKKSYTVNFPLLENYNLKRLFLRGYFEGDGCVATQNTKAKVPKVSISSNSSNMLNSIHEYVGNGCVYKNQILWGYNKALEFLDLIYKNHNDLFLERKYNLYIYWKNNYIFNSRKNRRVFQ